MILIDQLYMYKVIMYIEVDNNESKGVELDEFPIVNLPDKCDECKRRKVYRHYFGLPRDPACRFSIIQLVSSLCRLCSMSKNIERYYNYVTENNCVYVIPQRKQFITLDDERHLNDLLAPEA
jgi:hypothetical protein